MVHASNEGIVSSDFSQCIPDNSICSGSLTKFTYFGVNEAGAEFGNTNVPGVLGTDYTWPTEDSIDVSLYPPGCAVSLR
jgi:endoglucanase